MTENTVETQIHKASVTMADARKQYGDAVEAMKLLEAEKSLLVGPPWDADHLTSTVKKFAPTVLKWGSVIAGSGGIASALSGPDGIRTLLGTITSALGMG